MLEHIHLQNQMTLVIVSLIHQLHLHFYCSFQLLKKIGLPINS